MVFVAIIFGFRYNIIYYVDKHVINLFLVYFVKSIYEDVKKRIQTKYCLIPDDLRSLH